MSYIGSTPTNQSFIAGTDSFNGTGSATNFTLSRSVNSTNDIQVVVNNVVQYPPNYSVSGNTLTISPAPSAGTNNVYVRYLSTTLQSIAPSQGSSIQFGTGSVGLPSISFIGDTNTGIYSPAADTLAFVEGGVEAMRINSSANVGIGTDSPNSAGVSRAVTINGSTDSILELNVNGTRGAYFFSNAFNTVLSSVYTGVNLSFNTNDTTQARLTTTGLFQFNSGYGSVATAFGCRAWVNFNGTGTVAIRGSGNVTSITDNGTGQYIVNFTNAMPDTNYASPIEYSRLFGGFSTSDVNRFVSVVAKTTTSVSVQSTIATGPAFDDIASIGVAIFR